MNEIALAVQNVAVAYGEKPVVTDVNMEFPAHQITALIGASGSGKST
ncbi:MAG TPA: phosphate ABC transporter ATP-binding protein, partial [Limosilactobacillus ingluviei]|nr:phosphate ABC transporter ATP-binding protein [Limosilactobacillus ingluviei]